MFHCYDYFVYLRTFSRVSGFRLGSLLIDHGTLVIETKTNVMAVYDVENVFGKILDEVKSSDFYKSHRVTNRKDRISFLETVISTHEIFPNVELFKINMDMKLTFLNHPEDKLHEHVKLTDYMFIYREDPKGICLNQDEYDKPLYEKADKIARLQMEKVEFNMLQKYNNVTITNIECDYDLEEVDNIHCIRKFNLKEAW